MTKQGYQLIDSGEGRKLERFGDWVLDRPASQAIWPKSLSAKEWKQAHARFKRLNEKEGNWQYFQKIPHQWIIEIEDIKLKISPTPFGHLGIFPEHLSTWPWLTKSIQDHPNKTPKVLNLFAYSGAGTMACSSAGAHTVHLDASKPMVQWAKDNASLNKMPQDKITWMLEDVNKYLKREVRRNHTYQGIVLDPPTFGRGPKKELFKFDLDLIPMVEDCIKLLDPNKGFLMISCHTPGVGPQSLVNLLRSLLPKIDYKMEAGEMTSPSSNQCDLPSGVFARVNL